MSREQANTYKKFRTADDRQGNLGWAARMNRRGMKTAPEAPAGIESTFEFNEKEKALWGLLRMARTYNDIENCGLLTADDVRAFLRGLVSADVLDIVEHDVCRALLPLEVKRALGKRKSAKKVGGLKPRVYRPDIGLDAPKTPPPTPAPVETESPAAVAPRRVDSRAFATPPPSGHGLLTREEKARQQIIEEGHKKLATQNHYEFLGVAKDADPAALKAAYMKRARELHPDNLAGSDLQKDDELVEKADKLFKHLQEVNSVLQDPATRQQYTAKLASGEPTSAKGGKIRRPDEAKLAFKKAEVFSKRKDYHTAELHYKTAVDLDGEDPAIGLGYAWCIFLNERQPLEKRTEIAKKRLVELYEKKEFADAAYKLGLISVSQNDAKKASTWFDRCLRLQPTHPEARQEKRLRDRRAQKEKNEKDAQNSLMGRLFKK